MRGSQFSPKTIFYPGRYLSDPARQNGRMKMKYLLEQLRGRDGATIAVFGAARLVKHLDGKIQLVGGTRDDRHAAREWCSLYLHEAAIAGAA